MRAIIEVERPDDGIIGEDIGAPQTKAIAANGCATR